MIRRLGGDSQARGNRPEQRANQNQCRMMVPRPVLGLNRRFGHHIGAFSRMVCLATVRNPNHRAIAAPSTDARLGSPQTSVSRPSAQNGWTIDSSASF